MKHKRCLKNASEKVIVTGVLDVYVKNNRRNTTSSPRSLKKEERQLRLYNAYDRPRKSIDATATATVCTKSPKRHILVLNKTPLGYVVVCVEGAVLPTDRSRAGNRLGFRVFFRLFVTGFT